MAVISVDPIPDGREGGWNRLYQRTYTSAWRVECDSRLDGPVTIRLATDGGSPPAPLLPRIGASYYLSPTEFDTGSFASDIAYRFEELWYAGGVSGCAWVVTAQYTPYDAAAFGENAVEWPLKVTFTSNKYERVLQIDQNGDPVVNSAGVPFADPLMIDDTRSIITVVRNERIKSVPADPLATPPTSEIPGYNFSLAETYHDTVNNATWNGFAEKVVKCSSITTGDPQYDSNNDYWYYVVTYVFEINRDTWTKKVVDQGLYHLVSGALVRITDGKGQPVDEPKLLDGSGGILAAAGTPVDLEFEGYPASDFSVFNLDFNDALGLQ